MQFYKAFIKSEILGELKLGDKYSQVLTFCETKPVLNTTKI